MKLIATDPPIIIEPIQERPIQPDLIDWPPWHFTGTPDRSQWPSEPISLPVIEW